MDELDLIKQVTDKIEETTKRIGTITSEVSPKQNRRFRKFVRSFILTSLLVVGSVSIGIAVGIESYFEWKTIQETSQVVEIKK